MRGGEKKHGFAISTLWGRGFKEINPKEIWEAERECVRERERESCETGKEVGRTKR